MTDDSTNDNQQDQPTGSTQQMIELMEAEIERLKVSLELARSGESSNRRSLIKQHVTRIDERQDALETLRALQQAVRAAD